MSPFTPAQIEALNRYQHSGAFHPFTCGSGRRTDKDHNDGEGILVATPEGWACPFCDYRQKYRHLEIEMLSTHREMFELGILQAAIRRLRDAWQNGDDKCWKDLEELFRLLPEGYQLPERDESVELDLCRQYIASCHHPGISYVSPQRRIEELEAEVARLQHAVEEEREACAQIARDDSFFWRWYYEGHEDNADIANAIRARGKKQAP